MLVRRGGLADLGDIVRIYNHYILHSVATFDVDPVTVESRGGWLHRFDDESPLFVCESEQDGVLGYAYYLPFRDRAAYSGTKECSVYVAPEHHRKGAGSALYGALLEHARSKGVHVMVGVLGGANEGSAALHRRFGFTLAGRLPEVGQKHGGYVDTFYYHRLV